MPTPNRHTVDLFVCLQDDMVCTALSKKQLAGLHCEDFCQANRQAGKDPPSVVRAHSTCSLTVYVFR